jgi:hypothetical protein
MPPNNATTLSTSKTTYNLRRDSAAPRPAVVDAVDATPLQHQSHPLFPLVEVQLQGRCSHGRDDEEALPSSDQLIWDFTRRYR